MTPDWDMMAVELNCEAGPGNFIIVVALEEFVRRDLPY